MEFNILNYLRLRDKICTNLNSKVSSPFGWHTFHISTIYSTTREVVIIIVCLFLRDLFAGDDFWMCSANRTRLQQLLIRLNHRCGAIRLPTEKRLVIFSCSTGLSEAEYIGRESRYMRFFFSFEIVGRRWSHTITVAAAVVQSAAMATSPCRPSYTLYIIY